MCDGLAAVVDDARGGHGASAWKSRNETIASEKVVPVPVRDENCGKRPARARDRIAECVDVFPDQRRVYENRVASSEDQRGCRRRKRSIGVACSYHSGLCHQPQTFSFRIVAHFAGRVEIHGCLVFSRVCRPMRQAVVIGIPVSGKVHPGSTDLFR